LRSLRQWIVGTAIWVNGSVIFIYTNSVPLIPFLRTVYYVLLHLYKRLPLGSFFKLLEDGGPSLTSATRLLEVYAREQNREMLRDFYYSDDRRVESAILCMEEASWTKVTAFRKDTLQRLSAHARCIRSPLRKSVPSNRVRNSSRRIRTGILKPRSVGVIYFESSWVMTD
jgi:hypothetical protein